MHAPSSALVKVGTCTPCLLAQGHHHPLCKFPSSNLQLRASGRCTPVAVRSALFVHLRYNIARFSLPWLIVVCFAVRTMWVCLCGTVGTLMTPERHNRLGEETAKASVPCPE